MKKWMKCKFTAMTTARGYSDMRTTEKKLVEVTETTYRCDFCDYHTNDNTGGARRPIAECDFCKRDICMKHRHELVEDIGSDYYDFIVCCTCWPKISKVWEYSLHIAGRHESIRDVVERVLEEVENGYLNLD